MVAGDVQLADDRAVHLAVVAHQDDRLIRQIFHPDGFDFGVAGLHSPLDVGVQPRPLLLTHKENISRQSGAPTAPA